MRRLSISLLCLLCSACGTDAAGDVSLGDSTAERTPHLRHDTSVVNEPDMFAQRPDASIDSGPLESDATDDELRPREGEADVTRVEPDLSEGPEVNEPTEVDPDTPDDEPLALGGGLLIFELSSEFLNQAGAGARFVDALAEQPAQTMFGPCALSYSDPDAPPAPPAWGYDAGTITVNGTTPVVTLTPLDEGAAGTGYESGLSESLESLLPSGGALLNISSAGGADIPAFQAYLQVPEEVNISAPATGLFGSVSSSSDLTVSWNAGSGEAVLVTLTPLSATFQAIAGEGLVCTLEDDLGSFTIASAALQAMKSSGVSKVAIGVTRMRTSTANAGAFELPLAVTRSSGGPVGLD